MITEQEIRSTFPMLKPPDAARLANAANKNKLNIGKLTAAIETAAKVLNYVVGFVQGSVELIKCHYRVLLREVATPKEWHLMHHAKRRRTRHKYENRLARRLQSIFDGRRT